MKIIILIFINLLISFNSLYFELIKENDTCFYDEYYTENIVVVVFNVIGINPEEKQENILLESIKIKLIRDESDSEVQSFSLNKISGKQTFHIKDNGMYRICAMNINPKLFKNQIFLKMQIESDISGEKNVDNALKHHELNPVTEKIDKIISRSKNIVEAQKQETEIEDSFSMIQMNYTWNFTIISIIQIFVVIFVGLYHIYSFRKFLANNNLIDL